MFRKKFYERMNIQIIFSMSRDGLSTRRVLVTAIHDDIDIFILEGGG